MESSKRYVDMMGGADAILEKARPYYDRGDYRWVAQVVNHVVFADPTNQAARDLQADALEQLGYQAELGVWRNFYLSGAQDLRKGVADMAGPNTASPDVIKAMNLDLYFDYVAMRVNHPKADGKHMVLNFIFPDINEQYMLELSNGVLSHAAGEQAGQPN